MRRPTPKEYEEFKNLRRTTKLRWFLLIPGRWKWNAWVRDFTAWLERKFPTEEKTNE